MESGFAYRFPRSDEMIAEIADFIKTERECCDFFRYALFVDGKEPSLWLELTGPPGTKEFIITELGL